MQNERIPKVIHLMWFSGDPYPPLICKCLQSWHDIVPDYKIKLWTYDMIKDLDYKYLQDALKVKKYAFACDVVRAYALYTEGGVYMDSDVFLKRRFDEYLVHNFVSFFETSEIWNDKEVDDIYYENGVVTETERKRHLQRVILGREIPYANGEYKHTRITGVDISFMASVKGHPFLKNVLEMYKTLSFIKEDGSLNIEQGIGPMLYASCAVQFGFQMKVENQLLSDDMMLFRDELYNRLGRSGFAVHCCNHSWWNYDRKNWILNKCRDFARLFFAKLHLYSMIYRYLKYDK